MDFVKNISTSITNFPFILNICSLPSNKKKVCVRIFFSPGAGAIFRVGGKHIFFRIAVPNSFFLRDREKEKGLGMMPGLTLFFSKKVGHRHERGQNILS